MKRKITTIFSLFLLVFSIFGTSLSPIAQANTESSSSIAHETDKQENSQNTVENNIENDDTEELNSDTVVTSSEDELNSTATEDDTLKTEVPNESQPRAPTEESNRASQDDVITSFNITDRNGNPITGSVNQWDSFRINGNFEIPNNTVSAGDTTTLKLPESLKFANSSSFEVKDSEGNIIAHAVIDPNTKTLVLTYTDYVENHSDIKGDFFFYVRVDTDVVTEGQKIPVEIETGQDVTIGAGEINYVPEEPKGGDLQKSGWFESGSNDLATFRISVNTAKKAHKKVTITDTLQTSGAKIVPGTVVIMKGTWVTNSNGGFTLSEATDVTSSYDVQINNNQNGFSVDLGDIEASDGFTITYKVKLDYPAVDGEKITNNATMYSEETKVTEANTSATYIEAGGTGEGSIFSIKIHKVNEAGEDLEGAEFDVIRDRTGLSVGKLVTDSKGSAEIKGLLKDNYTIIETKAPEGYELLNEPILITSSDFNEQSKEAFKTIINVAKRETININGTKTWEDENDKDKIRPNSIKVNLLADGEAVGSKEVTSETDWKYSFENLPKYNTSGQEIIYTVTEDKVDGYETSIEGFDITNTHTVKPTDPVKPTKPTEPTKPSTTNPGTSGISNTNVNANTNGNGKTLPSTGEQASLWAVTLGSLIVLGAAGIYIFKRKTSK